MIAAFGIVVATFVAVLNIVFATEIFAGLRFREAPSRPMTGVSTVILMPANDEAGIIEATLTALLAILPPDTRVLVVADNCTDNTADVARRTGVEVVVRNDAERIGKGFALACGRDHLSLAPPDVVVVLDADCQTDTISLSRLISLATETERPVQGMSLLSPDLSASSMVQVSNFAFAVKNRLRNPGLQRLSGQSLLNGTGMAFPWAIFRSVALASSEIVEDLAMGLDLARTGTPPLITVGATVWSRSSGAAGTLKQRARWEGGSLATSARRALAVIGRSMIAFSPRDFWAGLSLLVPPLSLLFIVDACVCAAAVIFSVSHVSNAPLWIAAGSTLFASIAVITAWFAIGRRYLAISAALSMPFYVLWKLPLYLRILRGSPAKWLRSGR